MNKLLFTLAGEVAGIISNIKGKTSEVLFQPRLEVEKKKIAAPTIVVCPHSLEITPIARLFDKYEASVNVNFVSHTKFLDSEKIDSIYRDINLVDSVLRRKNLLQVGVYFQAQWVRQVITQEPGWEYEAERRMHVLLATVRPTYILVERDMLLE